MGFSQQTIKDCALGKIYEEVGTAAKGKGDRPYQGHETSQEPDSHTGEVEEREAIEKMWAQKTEVATRPGDETSQVAGTI